MKEYRLEWDTDFQVLEDKVNQAAREGYAIFGAPQIAEYEKEVIVVQALVKVHRRIVADPNKLVEPNTIRRN